MKSQDANTARPSKPAHETVLRYALHYAKLGLATTPAYHDADGKCSKHPSVRWKRAKVEAGEIVGATTDPAQLRRYFLEDGRLADICIHTVPSGFIGVECDRDWKIILAKGEDGVVRREPVWVDGLKNLLDFLKGDLGTDLLARSKRGLHAYYSVDSEVAQKILTQAGQFLPGVDVRGGANSGGVLVEANGVCPHRRWVRGKPEIDYTNDPLGEIVGVADCGEIRFDDQGLCVSGLPTIDPNNRLPVGIGEMPKHLLEGLLLASRAMQSSDVDPRAVVAMQELKSAKARQKLLRETKKAIERGAKAPAPKPQPQQSDTVDAQRHDEVDAPAASAMRPWLPDAKCTCGRCGTFEEARELLSYIPPEVNRDLWLQVIWAASHMLDHSSCGAQLVAAWSEQSMIDSRRDAQQAERIYQNDRRFEHGVDRRSEEDLDETFLKALAVLCGAPKRDDVTLDQLQKLAHAYGYTLINECAVECEARVRELLVDIFEPIPEVTASTGTATPGSPDGRPIIVITAGKLHEVTRKAEDALLKARDLEPVYQRGTELVRIVRLPDRQMLVPGAEVAAHVPIILPVGSTWLRAQFERAADFMGHDARSKKLVKKNCPADVPTLFEQQQGEWRVPKLTAIVQAPTLRPDGTVLQQPGYDAVTGIVYDPCGVTFPAIPDSPTMADAQAAVKVLLEAVRQFPWVNDYDRAVWLAAVLTAFVRPSLPSAPMFMFDSPVRGSGKTKLATLVSVIATGNEPSLMIHVDDDNEQRKRLFALLLRGVPIICVDNIDRPLEGASLCAVLTSPILEDRILGESRTASVSTASTLIGTGNNLQVVGDLTRRVLVCRVDPQVEQPENRPFDFDPVVYARQHRPRLVAAALTVLRAHVVAGSPAVGLTPFGSFEAWSRQIRGALVWAGEPDPLLGREAVQEVDDQQATFTALLQLWHREHGDGVLTIREALNASGAELRQILDLVGGDDPRNCTKVIGKMIAANRGRVYGGLRFTSRVGHGGIRRWRAERV